jgi:DNA-binding MarR family transcriptional regulator
MAERKSARHLPEAATIENDLNAIRRILRMPIEAEITKSPLTAPQIAAMRVVVKTAGISLKELSRAMGLAHSTVSGIVDRLAQRGLIERKQDAGDGRITRIHATREVAAFVREEIPLLRRGRLDEALERVSKPEREQIANAIKRLRELLEGSGPGSGI